MGTWTSLDGSSQAVLPWAAPRLHSRAPKRRGLLFRTGNGGPDAMRALPGARRQVLSGREPVAEPDADRVRLQIDVDRVEMGGGHVGCRSVVGKEVFDAPTETRAEGVSQAGAQGPAP